MVATTFDHVTISSVFGHRAKTEPERVFLSHHDPRSLDTRALTFGECAAQVATIESKLRAAGVRPGDRVAVCFDNSPDLIVGMLAALGAGAIAVPLAVADTVDDVAFFFQHSRCAAAVTQERYFSAVERMTMNGGEPAPVICETIATVSRRPHRSPSIRPDDSAAPPGQRLALLLYTSGTTGRPKGVLLSHAACLAAGASVRDETAMTPDDCSLCVLPLAHVSAICHQLIPALLTGSRLAVSPLFTAERYWATVLAAEATLGHLPGGLVRSLLDLRPTPQEAINPMRMMVTWRPLERPKIHELRTRSVVAVSTGWGLTESGGAGTRLPAHLDAREDRGSAGLVSAGWRVRVVDSTGADLPAGEVGELLVRGPSLMAGYFDDGDVTAAVDNDGWLHTGDLGRIGDAGYVHVLGRIDDAITVRGERVDAGEIEAAVRALPQIRDCAVVGDPESPADAQVVAFIVVADGRAISDAALYAYCRAELSPEKVPTAFVRIEELPRTCMGDVRRDTLRVRARYVMPFVPGRESED